LPLVPERFGLVELASGLTGRATPLAPEASCTRKYWPGWIVASGRAKTWVKLPVDEPYCTDFPASETGTGPRLNSSTKSCV